jgi:hypothetical protein
MKRIVMVLLLVASLASPVLAGEKVSIKDIYGKWNNGQTSYIFTARDMYVTAGSQNGSSSYTVASIKGNRIDLDLEGDHTQTLFVKEKGKILTVVSFFGDKTDFYKVKR